MLNFRNILIIIKNEIRMFIVVFIIYYCFISFGVRRNKIELRIISNRKIG